MILIADSGSTKCDWIEIDESGIQKSFQTVGLNPAYLTEGEISGIINASNELLRSKDKIREIYFFGAGCGESKLSDKVQTILSHVFYNAKSIVVKGDIDVAVHACTEKPGVVGILGTGCNVCYFDGEDIEFKIPSLGFSLIDDGSGTDISRRLLRSYYLGTMPSALRKAFKSEYELNPEIIKQKLYKERSSSRYLASFTPFLFEHIEDSFMKQILKDALEAFFDNLVSLYKKELVDVPLHFVGSVAYYSKDMIHEICTDRGIKLGHIVKEPISILVKDIKKLKAAFGKQ